MQNKVIRLGEIEISNDKPFVLFGGMNVLESRDMAMQVCEAYVKVTEKLGCLMCLRLLLTRQTAHLSILIVGRVWNKV